MENKWIGSAQECSVFVVPLLGRVRLATVTVGNYTPEYRSESNRDFTISAAVTTKSMLSFSWR